jgi:hypothetical protein
MMMIEAMKQALEALETCQIYADGWHGPDYMFDDSKVSQAITALRQAIAKAERKSQEFPKHFDTHQSKREWVGLTDDELSDLDRAFGIWSDQSGHGVVKFYQAIEAKLKEKNT